MDMATALAELGTTETTYGTAARRTAAAGPAARCTPTSPAAAGGSNV